jgi:hypothetical protein
MKTLTILFICLSALAVSAQKVSTIDFCNLVRNHAAYDKQIVRTKAYYNWDGGDFTLNDPRCRNGDASMETGVEESKEFRTAPEVEAELDRILSAETIKGARVTVIGRFHDWNGRGYGRLNSLRFQFMVLSWVSVKAVEAPLFSQPDSDFMMDVRFLRFISSEWNIAFIRGTRPGGSIESDIVERYEFTDSTGKRAGRDPFPRAACGAGAPEIRVGAPPIFFDGNVVTAAGEGLSYSCPLNIQCQYRYEHRFEKIDGQWKLVKTHVTYGPVHPFPRACQVKTSQ